jgi:IPT/TIG domain/Putative Ig domain
MNANRSLRSGGSLFGMTIAPALSVVVASSSAQPTAASRSYGSVIRPFHLHHRSFALVATLAAILTVLGLSSCTGHTSATGTSPATPITAGPSLRTTPGLVITTSSLPAGQGQAAYTARLGATGGTAPYSWHGIVGSLPPGLTLDASTGNIAGAPTKTGAFSVTVQVADSADPPQTANRAFSLTISAPPLQIATSSLPGGAVGVSYSSTLNATNGIPPYTWSLHGGQFPPGLSLQGSNGQISGTPSQTGAFSFSVQARDSAGQTVSTNLNANNAPAFAPIVSSISPASGSTSGGTLVTVSGSNFHAGATVLFGGITALAVIVGSATQIQAAAPDHNSAGIVDVTVRNLDGETSTHVDSFTYTAPLTSTHKLYAINAGPVISVYDLDSSGFNLVKQIRAGTSTEQIRGVVASAVDGMLYISYGCTSPATCAGHLMKYNLATDQKVWDTPYPLGIDSHAITPDGKTIYMPTGEGDLTHSQWQIIDTSSGNLTGSIDSTVKAPHNTIVGNNGTHVYMGSVHSDVSGDHRNYLVEANTSDGSIVQEIGPTLGIATRPFTIDSQERWAFIITLGLNGFQVGSISTGAILFTVPAQGVSNASCTAFVTCSHGISLSPDDKEIYMVDYYNNYVHVFDVSGLPSAAPQWVTKIPLAHSYTESGASVTHSRDGRFVFVGQSGDVIDTNTRRIVGYLPALNMSKIYTEVDFQGSQVSFTPLSRSGVGYAH